MRIPAIPTAATRCVRYVGEIDPVTRAIVFGDGLTAAERFRNDISRYAPPEEIDSLVSQMLDAMAHHVAAGRMIPILSDRGVVGWGPVAKGRRGRRNPKAARG
jgi:hypothetical protein